MSLVRAEAGAVQTLAAPPAGVRPFTIQRGLASGFTAATQQVTISAVDLAKAIVREPMSAPGTLVGTSTFQEPDEGTHTLQFDDTTHFTITGLLGHANGRRVPWEVWEVEAETGAYGVKLIYFDDVTLSSGTTQVDQALSGVSNINDCAAIVCSARSPRSVNTAMASTVFRAQIVDVGGTPTLRVIRGASADTCVVVVAVIEFTGAAWSVEQVSHTFAAAGSDETKLIASTTWANAFVVWSLQCDDDSEGNCTADVWPGDSTHINLRTGGDAPSGVTVTAFVVRDTTGQMICETQAYTCTGQSQAVPFSGTFPSESSIAIVGAHYSGSINQNYYAHAAVADRDGDQQVTVYRHDPTSQNAGHVQLVKWPGTAP